MYFIMLSLAVMVRLTLGGASWSHGDPAPGGVGARGIRLIFALVPRVVGWFRRHLGSLRPGRLPAGGTLQQQGSLPRSLLVHHGGGPLGIQSRRGPTPRLPRRHHARPRSGAGASLRATPCAALSRVRGYLRAALAVRGLCGGAAGRRRERHGEVLPGQDAHGSLRD